MGVWSSIAAPIHLLSGLPVDAHTLHSDALACKQLHWKDRSHLQHGMNVCFLYNGFSQSGQESLLPWLNQLQTCLHKPNTRHSRRSTHPRQVRSHPPHEEYSSIIPSQEYEGRHYVIFFIIRSFLPMFKYSPQYLLLKHIKSIFLPLGDFNNVYLIFEMLQMSYLVVQIHYFRKHFIQRYQLNALSVFIFGNSNLQMEATSFLRKVSNHLPHYTASYLIIQ
jgi:hypothetical protein